MEAGVAATDGVVVSLAVKVKLPARVSVILLKVANPETADLLMVPPRVPTLGATRLVSVSVVWLPYWSVILTVKLLQVAPAVTGEDG